MINMFVTDENKNLSELLQIVHRNFSVRKKFLFLSPPVIKNQQNILSTSNRKAAVVIMCDFDFRFHCLFLRCPIDYHLWDRFGSHRLIYHQKAVPKYVMLIGSIKIITFITTERYNEPVLWKLFPKHCRKIEG